jgi:hypothetical protein
MAKKNISLTEKPKTAQNNTTTWRKWKKKIAYPTEC